MGAPQTFGTLVYMLSIGAMIYALLQLSWSTAKTGSSFFRLGLFSGHGFVSDPTEPFTLEGYLWCRAVRVQSLFEGPDDYCKLWTVAQIAGLASVGLGLMALALSFVLSWGMVKEAYKVGVARWNVTLMLTQAVTGAATFALWYYINDWMNRDLKRAYPDTKIGLQLGVAWYVVVASTGLALFSCFFVMCCCGRRNAAHRKAEDAARQILEADYKADEDLRSIIASTY